MSLRFALFSVFSAACLAGCSIGIPSSAEIQGSGDSSGLQTQTVSCQSLATLDINVAGGGGTISIRVTDGAGHVVYANGGITDGSTDNSQQLDGTSGMWTLRVDPEGWAGSFDVDLQCL